METITFQVDNNKGNKITFTVLKEFEQVCPNYKELSVIELISEHDIIKYWHNENGPAVIDHANNIETYFLNGIFQEKVSE